MAATVCCSSRFQRWVCSAVPPKSLPSEGRCPGGFALPSIPDLLISLAFPKLVRFAKTALARRWPFDLIGVYENSSFSRFHKMTGGER
jgi:hypothetical protein